MKAIYSLLLLTTLATAAPLPPTPFPVFLKSGFSSVLEFEDVPTRVVLGDTQSFQVEKLEHSLVIRTLTPYASSNMFVYFAKVDPRLFVLSASEDAEPTYYKKFQAPVAPTPAPAANSATPRTQGARLLSAKFDNKKDYLTVEVEIGATSGTALKPTWANVRLRYGANTIAPYKLWAERKDVQKDSRVRSRFIFAKPNVPRDLGGASLIIPIEGQATAMTLALKGSSR